MTTASNRRAQTEKQRAAFHKLALGIIASALGFPACAGDLTAYHRPSLTPTAIGFVKDSYIVTFKESGAERSPIAPLNKAGNLSKSPVPFGEHNTGQSKTELALALGINGEVVRIFETINAAQIHMSPQQADKLSLDRRVLRVQQEAIATAMSTTQTNPQWALDRIDSGSPALNNSYTYTNDGTGQTIFILDSGLNVGSSSVTAEFGTRATMLFDFNGGTGNDCIGHGSEVASAAAGNAYGVAKGAALNIVKITSACTGSSSVANSIASFNWIAANSPAGTIVNWSQGFSAPSTVNPSGDPVFTCGSYFDTGLENSIIAAHNAGIIVVVAAGNDGCNTANYSPANIAEAFVVGATQNSLINSGLDSLAEYHGTNGTGNGGTRVGGNISTFAPGRDVRMLWWVNGFYATDSGTSFAAPYIAGVFAVVCQAIASLPPGSTCNTAGSAVVYSALRSTGAVGTVVKPDGSALTSPTASRFIWQQW